MAGPVRVDSEMMSKFPEDRVVSVEGIHWDLVVGPPWLRKVVTKMRERIAEKAIMRRTLRREGFGGTGMVERGCY